MTVEVRLLSDPNQHLFITYGPVCPAGQPSMVWDPSAKNKYWFLRPEVHSDIQTWGGTYALHFRPGRGGMWVFEFTNPATALLFKLKWGGR